MGEKGSDMRFEMNTRISFLLLDALAGWRSRALLHFLLSQLSKAVIGTGSGIDFYSVTQGRSVPGCFRYFSFSSEDFKLAGDCAHSIKITAAVQYK